MARVVFMGTPEFAIPSLEALHAHHQVVLVVTQPDRTRGRGRKLTLSPVKEWALRHDLPVWQPATLHTAEAVQRLREPHADVYVTAAIGLLVPPDVLTLPPHGCLNVHASLLPRWRGAAPVSAAILHGDTETGDTLMLMDECLDTGPVLAQARCLIQPGDTAEKLTRTLARLGADLLAETLPHWLSGTIAPQPQPQEGATIADRLTKEDGRIDWSQPAEAIERMTRAYDPWPGTFTLFQGQRLRVLGVRVLPDWSGPEPPGTVLSLPDGCVGVATGRGALALEELQLAGKRALASGPFCCGCSDFVGARLGDADALAPDQ